MLCPWNEREVVPGGMNANFFRSSDRTSVTCIRSNGSKSKKEHKFAFKYSLFTTRECCI